MKNRRTRIEFVPPSGALTAGPGNLLQRHHAPGCVRAGQRAIGRRRAGGCRSRRGSLVTEFSVAVVILGGACSTLGLGLQAAHRLEHSAALRDRAIERAVNLLERARSIPPRELTPAHLTSLAAIENRPGSLALSAEILPPLESASAGPRSYPIVVRATWGATDAAAGQGLTLTGWATESGEAAP